MLLSANGKNINLHQEWCVAQKLYSLWYLLIFLCDLKYIRGMSQTKGDNLNSFTCRACIWKQRTVCVKITCSQLESNTQNSIQICSQIWSLRHKTEASLTMHVLFVSNIDLRQLNMRWPPSGIYKCVVYREYTITPIG